jgi:heat shock protein HslJ
VELLALGTIWASLGTAYSLIPQSDVIMATPHFVLTRTRATLILIITLLSSFRFLPADDQQPNQPTQEESNVVNELIYKWELKEVRYKNGRKPFVPQRYSGFTLYANGGIGWSDGCNHLGAQYRIEGNKFSIGPRINTTLIGCSFEIEDVHYEQAIHYQLEGRTLYLHTTSQVYVLEKFPYSRLSLNAWSLYSITDRQTGEEFNVDRFRTGYHHLLFRVEKDSIFRFTDLDGEEFTGSLQVEDEAIRGMAYDQASQDRLHSKPEQQDYLADSTQRYQKTKEKYPTTYAHQINWEAVSAFKVLEGTVTIEAEERKTMILELSSDTQIYRFIPR